VLQEQKKAEGLIAFREEKIAIIPSKAGGYKLPAIEVHWFNTQSQKMEIARIPETTITAAAGTQSAPQPPAVPAVEQPQKIEATPIIQTQPDKFWLWVSVFLALGWLATLVYFLTRRTGKKPVIEKDGRHKEMRLADSVKALKKACADNDAVAAKNALLAWGRQTSLGAIAAQSDAQLRDEILHLNRVLYGREADQWHGKKLFQAFVENKTGKKIAVTDDDKLEPLYRL
jgi:hypothetical protein